MTQDEIDDAEWRNAKNWHLGMFYFSRLDRRAFVPKRDGIGASLNFANGFAVTFLLIVLVGVAVVLAR